ncbi:unnamed protein product [Anisakis simplex]|uniref:Secreted protein n=1 Tax=Anisakis simplex TaxID=6269 RepID=A0A0M3K584_ANISI|nr:unnamed protein product [Anisakis simplex]
MLLSIILVALTAVPLSHGESARYSTIKICNKEINGVQRPIVSAPCEDEMPEDACQDLFPMSVEIRIHNDDP